MAKYKILAIQHLLKNNKIAKAGEIIEASKFINLQESLDGKFCEKYKEVKEEKQEDSPLEKELKLIKSLKKDDLIEYATKNEIDFDSKLDKPALLGLIIKVVTEDFQE